METLESILALHPFFEGFDKHYLGLIAGCAANVRFEADQFLFRDGEEANHFFIIRQGRVALEIFAPGHGPVAVDTYGEGEILGWSWLVPPYHWHYDARATQPLRVIALDGRCLRGKCEDDHELGYELLKRFASIIEQRLSATRLQLLDVYGDRRR